MQHVFQNPWLRSICFHIIVLSMLLGLGVSYREPLQKKVQSVTVRLSSPVSKSKKMAVTQKEKKKQPVKKKVTKTVKKQPVKKAVKLKKKSSVSPVKKKSGQKKAKRSQSVSKKKVKNTIKKSVPQQKKSKVIQKKAKAKKAEVKKLSKQLEKSMLSNMDQMLKQEQTLLENESQRLLEEAFMVSKQKVLDHLRVYWKVPSGLDKTLSVVLEISCDQNGEVMSVKVVKSSGNIALDRSSRRTVLKSSPLPMPKRNEIKSLFRHFQLTLKP